MNIEHDDLKEFIRRVPDFPKEGIVFRDIAPLLATPHALSKVIDIFNEDWDGKVDVIVGLDARGFIFASLLASKMGLPFVMVRKKGKLPGNTISIDYALEYGTASVEIQEDAFQKGDRVLVVDDLLATGGTALAACQLITTTEAEIAGCAFVIELEELGGAEKLKEFEVRSILCYNDRVPIQAVDCIAVNEKGEHLFIERLNFPSGLALAGGKQDPGETLEETIVREVKEETGLEFTIDGKLGVYDKPGRDPRGNFVTTVFYGRVRGTPKNEEGKTKVFFFNPFELMRKDPKEFAFDHLQILKDYFLSIS